MTRFISSSQYSNQTSQGRPVKPIPRDFLEQNCYGDTPVLGCKFQHHEDCPGECPYYSSTYGSKPTRNINIPKTGLYGFLQRYPNWPNPNQNYHSA